jgi:hypothetical protein
MALKALIYKPSWGLHLFPLDLPMQHLLRNADNNEFEKGACFWAQ